MFPHLCFCLFRPHGGRHGSGRRGAAAVGQRWPAGVHQSPPRGQWGPTSPFSFWLAGHVHWLLPLDLIMFSSSSWCTLTEEAPFVQTRVPLSSRSCSEPLRLSTHSGGDGSYSPHLLSDWSKNASKPVCLAVLHHFSEDSWQTLNDSVPTKHSFRPTQHPYLYVMALLLLSRLWDIYSL